MSIKQSDLDVLSPEAREEFLLASAAAKSGDEHPLRVFAALHSYPVSVKTFVTDPSYLGSSALYEGVLDALVELNNPKEPGREHRARLFTRYTEAVLTGAIGTGKTSRVDEAPRTLRQGRS